MNPIKYPPELAKVLRYSGMLGHEFVVIEPDGTRYRCVAECITLKDALVQGNAERQVFQRTFSRTARGWKQVS